MSNMAKAFLNGAPWGYACPHVHVSGRRCANRTAASKVLCSDHQRTDLLDRCAECRAMLIAFGMQAEAEKGSPGGR